MSLTPLPPMVCPIHDVCCWRMDSDRPGMSRWRCPTCGNDYWRQEPRVPAAKVRGARGASVVAHGAGTQACRDRKGDGDGDGC